MKMLTITNNIAEMLAINFDGERFALVHTNKTKAVTKTIIMNKIEADVEAQFIKDCLWGRGKLK